MPGDGGERLPAPGADRIEQPRSPFEGLFEGLGPLRLSWT
jgi:hypothetical protein